MTVDQVVAVIAGAVVAIAGAGAGGLWVFGWVYKAKAAEAESWKRLALQLAGINEVAIGQTAYAIGKPELAKPSAPAKGDGA